MEERILEDRGDAGVAVARIAEEQVAGRSVGPGVGLKGQSAGKRGAGRPGRRAAAARSGDRTVVHENIIRDARVAGLDRAIEALSTRPAADSVGGAARATFCEVAIEGVVVDAARRTAADGYRATMAASAGAARSSVDLVEAVTALHGIAIEDVVLDRRRGVRRGNGPAIGLATGWVRGWGTRIASRLVAGEDTAPDLDGRKVVDEYRTTLAVGTVRRGLVKAARDLETLQQGRGVACAGVEYARVRPRRIDDGVPRTIRRLELDAGLDRDREYLAKRHVVRPRGHVDRIARVPGGRLGHGIGDGLAGSSLRPAVGRIASRRRVDIARPDHDHRGRGGQIERRRGNRGIRLRYRGHPRDAGLSAGGAAGNRDVHGDAGSAGRRDATGGTDDGRCPALAREDGNAEREAVGDVAVVGDGDGVGDGARGGAGLRTLRRRKGYRGGRMVRGVVRSPERIDLGDVAVAVAIGIEGLDLGQRGPDGGLGSRPQRSGGGRISRLVRGAIDVERRGRRMAGTATVGGIVGGVFGGKRKVAGAG